MNLEALDRAMNICSSVRGIYSVSLFFYDDTSKLQGDKFKCSSKFPDIYYIN